MREELPPEGPPHFEIRVLPDPAEAAIAAARELVSACSDSLADHGVFRPAFSGGSTPRLFFDALAGAAFRSLVAWSRARIFFVDERAEGGGRERLKEKPWRRAAREGGPKRAVIVEAVRRRGDELPRRRDGGFGRIGKNTDLEVGRAFRRKLLSHFPSVRQRRPSCAMKRSAASGPMVPAA